MTSDWYFFDWRKGSLALATLGRDRWAGYEPVNREQAAVLSTVPLNPAGRLLVSADVSDSGSVGVTLLDEAGAKLAVSEPLRETVTNHAIRWAQGFSLNQAGAARVRLIFNIEKAKLYAFCL